MPRIVWTTPALSDLRAIEAWLEERAGEGVALRTLSAIKNRVKFLEDFPRGARPSPGGMRLLRVFHTPYLILYRLVGETVEVIRVPHEREDWQIEH